MKISFTIYYYIGGTFGKTLQVRLTVQKYYTLFEIRRVKLLNFVRLISVRFFYASFDSSEIMLIVSVQIVGFLMVQSCVWPVEHSTSETRPLFLKLSGGGFLFLMG